MWSKPLICCCVLSVLCLLVIVDGKKWKAQKSPKKYKVPESMIRYKEVRRTLYKGGAAKQFQDLCPETQVDPFCAGWDKDEMLALRHAQNRTKAFQDALEEYYTLTLQLIIVTAVLMMGSYLIVKRHFTLMPYFNSRARDPTSGHSYFVYMNMRWEIVENKSITQTEEEYVDDSHVVDPDEPPPGGWPEGYVPFHEQSFPRFMIKRRRFTKFENNIQRYQNNNMLL